MEVRDHIVFLMSVGYRACGESLLSPPPGPRALPASGRDGGSAPRTVEVCGCLPTTGPRTGCGTPSTDRGVRPRADRFKTARPELGLPSLCSPPRGGK